MRIAVTGASGFVGRHVVAWLGARGVEVVALGRDPGRLSGLGVEAAGYDDMERAFAGADAVLHLAAVNNDVEAPLETFREANVGLTRRVAAAAAAAGVPRLIHATTLQAATGTSSYAVTKREAERFLAGVDAPRVILLRLPAVYADTFRGKLSVLNRVPGPLRGTAFGALACLKPVTHADRVAEAVLSAATGPDPEPEIIVSDRQEGNRVYHAVSRLIDLLFAAAVFGLLFWLLIGTWIAVRATSRGPGLFVQDRVGRHGRVFRCYKFRTMAEGTPQAGTHDVPAASVTRVGRVLRATKIDELPQAFNLLRGDMSLVGPRPCLPVQAELVEARRARGVLEARGGITGLAQVRGVDMSDPQRLARLDAEYLALRAVPLDLKIVLRTFLGGGQGDKVRAGRGGEPGS